MIDLFQAKRLFEIVSNVQDASQCGIKLSAFSQVVNQNNQNHDFESSAATSLKGFKLVDFISKFNLALYCHDHRLLLFQFGNDILESNDSDENLGESRWRHLTIPLDRQKGFVISICFDRSGKQLLALTSQSFIYRIPFNFTTYLDVVSNFSRTVIQKDAAILRSCSLREPTSMVWWESDQLSDLNLAEQTSVAIVGDCIGNISMIDLDLDVEFKRFSVPFSIQSLSIFTTKSVKTLLINCTDNYQYHLMLEEFPNVSESIDSYPPNSWSDNFIEEKCTNNHGFLFLSNSPIQEVKNMYKSALNDFNNHISQIFNLSIENDNAPSKISPSIDSNNFQSKFIENNLNLSPQLITFHNETDAAPFEESMNKSKDIMASEFFCFPESERNSSSKISIYCQEPWSTSSNIYIVKRIKPKLKLSQTVSASSSGFDADFDSSISSDDLDSVFSESKNSKIKSSLKSVSSISDYCTVSFCQNEVLQIHEYKLNKFCTSKILPSSRSFFISNLSPKSHSQDDLIETENQDSKSMIRLIDCGSRFFFLVFYNCCYLVSKAFSQQSSPSVTSPRSLLSLKKNSIRRKNFKETSSSAIIHEFEFETEQPIKEPIVDAFLLNPGLSGTCLKEYLSEKIKPSSSSLNFNDPDSMAQQESQIIENLINKDIEKNLITIDEQLLVVTKRSVYLVESKEKSFGKYFHSEILSLLSNVENGKSQDGDIIAKAKVLVECFVKHQNFSHHESVPNQSWQIWLTRSALLLMQRIRHHFLEKFDLETVDECLFLGKKSNKIITELFSDNLKKCYRLLEISRTPRRRVIGSLNYFNFWSEAVRQIQKFFQTRVLVDLSQDEKIYFSEKLFDCFVSIYRYCLNKLDIANQAKQNLFNYFVEHKNYFISERIINKLVDMGFFNMASYVSLLTGDNVSLIYSALRNFARQDSMKQHKKLFEILTSKKVNYSLILSTDHISTHGKRSIILIENYIKFIMSHLPQLKNRQMLLRLASVIDPSNLTVRLLLNHSLEYCNQTYLCCNDSENYFIEQTPFSSFRIGCEEDDQESLQKNLLPIRRSDFINLYLFIMFLLLKTFKNSKIVYDWYFDKTLMQHIPNQMKKYDSAIVDLRRKQTETAKKLINFSHDWKLKTGSFHSMVYNSKQFILWGKFDFFNSSQCVSHVQFNLTRNTKENLKIGQYSPNSSTHYPKSNEFFSTVIKASIKSIASGRQHLIIQTEIGLFAVGSSAFGQLGLGSETLKTNYPTLIDFSVKISKLTCGSYHSLAIDVKGNLFSWGWALHGQLGHGTTEDEFLPKLVNFFSDNNIQVFEVAAGYAHTVVLTLSGSLYVFGENTFGQLGINNIDSPIVSQGRKSKICTPVLFDLIPGPFQLICCGLFHTVVVSLSDFKQRLYSWGIDPKTWRLKMRQDRMSFSNAKLNLNCTDKYSYSPLLSYAKVREISLNKLDVSSTIVKITAGQSHSMILTLNGKVYVFGHSKEGQLGLQGQSIESEATLIKDVAEKHFIDIDCGAFHSLALDEDGFIWGWGQNSDNQLWLDRSMEVASNLKTEHRFFADLSNSVPSSSVNPDESLLSKITIQKKYEPRIILDLSYYSKEMKSDQDVLENDYTFLEIPNLGEANRLNKKWLKQKILDTIIFQQHDLNFQSLVKRLDRLELYQFCSYLTFSMTRDFSESFRYQLEAFYNKIVLSLKTENVNRKGFHLELVKIIRFYFDHVYSIHQSSPSVLVHSMLKHLVSFYLKATEQDILVEPMYFTNILEEIYLNSTASFGPDFGIVLLQLIEDEKFGERNLRERLVLSDQTLICLIEKTKNLLLASSQNGQESSFCLMQQFLEKDNDMKRIFLCLNSSSSSLRSLNQGKGFPLENEWQSLQQQFYQIYDPKKQCYNDETPVLSYHQLSNGTELEIRIPDDVENEVDDDDSLLLIFKCSHYMTKWKFLQIISNLKISSLDEHGQLEAALKLSNDDDGLQIDQNDSKTDSVLERSRDLIFYQKLFTSLLKTKDKKCFSALDFSTDNNNDQKLNSKQRIESLNGEEMRSLNETISQMVCFECAKIFPNES